ncbi:sugar phosphate isomerase/epimerase and 4-hydroxyphenylpyruvate domain-containing protein [Roseomonas sp. KE2513]|uniref:bifunctional sugar phosphate isomerase/epimerase/4-hydroxyphenylpyruvate dioxygenase family protein n=1 Tax=Roseomonas sp. KE2513 TaxID=2479202 RepID=UPI0018DEF9E5|nr:sugar phosphate isomerase/epimerase and 4-hydroxyphenylpyruvate domain-containing protein [Roseomonas sp. KE2513]MBI0535172.1 sugar phosphate isomerase/epimerase and 4-hydroxyphenylpyruvate domain-containing protein [Roseomonas sp. KE2513]
MPEPTREPPGAAFRALPKSIATVCLSGSLPDKLEAAASAGFAGVEIFEQDLLTHDGPPEGVRAMAADLGIGITIFQPFRDFEAMPEPQRRRNMDRAERKFDVMQALGTDLVLVCSNTQPGALDDPARAAADLREMAERAAARGLRVGYEALSWGRHVNRWRQAWEVVQRADHPALGLILDSFHTLALGDTLDGLAAEVPGERIAFVQLADAPRLTMDVLGWSRHFRNFPGQGELAVADFTRAVLEAGYGGPLSLEVFNDEFRAAPARRIARDGHRSLIWLDSVIAGPSVPAAPLPAPPALGGVEFLEFAVDERRGADLAAFLSTLGFRKAGQHRSKAVELWRQGGVNLVLNAEPDSAAAGHFELHGASVCATALRVDNAARTLSRAEALLCSTWRERVGEGERAIPAVRAPDGTLIYLVEPGARSIWESDFHLLPSESTGPALGGVDHVAHALSSGQMDGFVLFHRAVFGLEPGAPLDLPDPQGLVRSRAMADPAGRVRMPLNVSESRQTATGRFVSAIAGAGVHHVAFSTADAAAFVAGRAAPMLEIPANYYEDLGARFGLGDDELEALERGHLLYDGDGQGGAFVHAFTVSFEDRFFFEVVERRGGYDGYGAANAGVRMAAQARARPWMPPGS